MSDAQMMIGTGVDPRAESAALKEPRSTRFRWKKILIWVIAGFCLITFWVLRLLVSEPGYWKMRGEFLEATADPKLMEIAEILERRLLAGFTGVSTAAHSMDGLEGDQPDTRVLRIYVNEVNTWLNQRLGPWLSNQRYRMPNQIQEPMIAIEDGNLIVAFRYNASVLRPIVSGVFGIDLEEDGQIKVRYKGLRGGRMPLPAATVTQLLVNSDKPESQTAHFAQLLQAMDGETFDPVLTVDEHKIRIMDVQFTPRAIDLTISPEPKAHPVSKAR